MITITKFKAYTGAEFTDADACMDYEERCKKADAAIARLDAPPQDDGCQFANGHGFIQQDPWTFLSVRAHILRLAAAECDHKSIQQTLDDPDSIHPSWVGRVIEECCNDRLRAAWLRIYSTDKLYREWGQPYYAEHPREGDQKQLNVIKNKGQK